MEKLISWVEIPAANFDRAVDFYKSVFKLDLQKQDFGSEKMAFFPKGEGAISFAPNFKPSENGPLVSFTSPDSIDQTLVRVEKNGGKTIIPKTKIEAEGREFFATCLDSEGNRIGLYGK
jgi:predicted enzyme related to lactoylglutathione lyase